MLEFIVLGQIPGTNVRLSFPVIMALMLAIALVARQAIHRQHKAKENS